MDGCMDGDREVGTWISELDEECKRKRERAQTLHEARHKRSSARSRKWGAHRTGGEQHRQRDAQQTERQSEDAERRRRARALGADGPTN
eukprot:5250462-Pleurochrysis_carterae.AAC.1